MDEGMTISLRGLAKAIESEHPAYIAKGPAALRLAADEIERLRAWREEHPYSELDMDMHVEAVTKELRAVVRDMLSGLEYLRITNSIPYGFGIDRLERTGREALNDTATLSTSQRAEK
jgi:hypothetical protein